MIEINNPEAQIDFKRHKLTLETFTNRIKYSPKAIANMQHYTVNDLHGDAIYEVLAYIYSDKYQEDKIIKAPLNWWQHFKEEHFPRFLKKRFPVKYRDIVISLKHMRIYPDIPVKGNKFIHEVIEVDYGNHKEWKEDV